MKKKNQSVKKTQDYCVTFTHRWEWDNLGNVNVQCFIIKGVDVSREQAEKIVEILYPTLYDVRVESVVSDDATLTFDDYELLYSMVNNKLVDHIRATRTLYQNVKDPFMVMYKTLLEKMIKRKKQFRVNWF